MGYLYALIMYRSMPNIKNKLFCIIFFSGLKKLNKLKSFYSPKKLNLFKNCKKG